MKSKAKAVPAPTLQSVFSEYRKTRKLKASTADDYQTVFNRYVSDWLERGWLLITPDAFEQRFASVSIKSKAQANYLSRILSAVWSFASAKYGVTATNPTQRLKAMGGLHQIKPKDGVVPDSLQPMWWAAVEAMEDKEASAALIFIALTGCRRGEALRLQASDIDWQAKTVTFPDTKNGATHRLPLCWRFYALLVAHCRERPDLVFLRRDQSVRHSLRSRSRIAASVRGQSPMRLAAQSTSASTFEFLIVRVLSAPRPRACSRFALSD